MKEYAIYIRNGQGCPYILDKFKTLESVKSTLYNMVQLEEERERPYFVDNDFFNNKYNISIKLKYFQIREREVSDWEVFTSKNTIQGNTKKIIFLNSYKNLLTK